MGRLDIRPYQAGINRIARDFNVAITTRWPGAGIISPG